MGFGIRRKKISMPLRTYKPRTKLPGKKYTYIKIYNKLSAATVLISLAPWNKCFPLLKGCYSPSDNKMEKHSGLASIDVEYDSYYNVYYCSDPKVVSKFQGQGYGAFLYRAALLAVREHAKQYNRKNILFTSHQAVGSCTLDPAWRCYEGLCRKRYIKPVGKTVSHSLRTRIIPCSYVDSENRNTVFEIVKYPRDIKPTYIYE